MRKKKTVKEVVVTLVVLLSVSVIGLILAFATGLTERL